MPYKDPEKRKKYYAEHKRAYMQEYRAKHREEIKEQKRRYLRKRYAELPWILHLVAAKSRCNNPNNDSYKYYGGKGIRFLLTQLEVELLYKRDHADQMKRPSIDRINPKGDYHFGNCQFIEHFENCRETSLRRWREQRESLA